MKSYSWQYRYCTLHWQLVVNGNVDNCTRQFYVVATFQPNERMSRASWPTGAAGELLERSVSNERWPEQAVSVDGEGSG